METTWLEFSVQAQSTEPASGIVEPLGVLGLDHDAGEVAYGHPPGGVRSPDGPPETSERVQQRHLSSSKQTRATHKR